MAIDDEQAAIFLVFEALALRGQEHLRRKKDGVVGPVKRAAEAVRVLTLQEVRKYRETNTAQGSLAADSAIQIEPPNHERNNRLAYLWGRWDFSKSPPQCGFFYGVWYHFKPPVAPGGQPGDIVPAFLGYRYESPERGTNHAFYHCQPCLNLGDPAKPIIQAIERSEHNPTWPLAANDGISLLLCLVLSLYGFDEFTKFETALLQTRAAQRNAKLSSAIVKVRSLKF